MSDEVPYGYCHCGCGQLAPIAKKTDKSTDRIKGQPMRFISGHNGGRPAVERFWEKVNKNAPNGCWEWIAANDGRGYGVMGMGSKLVRAHRYSYELHNGPFPAALEILHRCDNPRCVNPDHLFVGSHAENMLDMAIKERVWTQKLTREQVIEIRNRYASRQATCKRMAQEYGVDRSTISAIVRRKNWKHIP